MYKIQSKTERRKSAAAARGVTLSMCSEYLVIATSGELKAYDKYCNLELW